jgi:predicted ATPase
MPRAAAARLRRRRNTVRRGGQARGGGDATLVAELHALLVAAGFGRREITAEESSRAAIAQWTDGAAVGEFVVRAFSTAHKLGFG